MSSVTTLVVHWPRFGPYHVSRLEHITAQLAAMNVRVIGLEIAPADKTYSWAVQDKPESIEYRVAFPKRNVEDLSFVNIFRRVRALLGDIRPDIVAINGYSSIDALAILLWCRLHGRRAILMSDSKVDDFPRQPAREAFKRWLVSHYSAGFCAGSLHREYLLHLGMSPEQIRLGYDAIDNNYFWNRAQIARHAPEQARNLPGLGFHEPYFLVSSRWIARKNIIGIILAYQQYRKSLPGFDCKPWRLVVLGDGPQTEEIRQLVSERQIEGVTFPGFRQIEELPAYYGHASAFIHVPVQEQWGLVVNEAMAAGLPVLVSKQCGCAPDLVVDGKNGFRVDAHDLFPLVDHMVRFTSGAYDCAAMGTASREIIQNWGLERFATSLLELTRLCSG